MQSNSIIKADLNLSNLEEKNKLINKFKYTESLLQF